MKEDLSQRLLNPPPKLGLIAGGGTLPQRIIHVCQKRNRPFFVLGIEGQTECSLDGLEHTWVKAGQIGKAISALKDHRVQHLLMVGYYKRPAWRDLRPDLRGAQWLVKFMGKVGTDDGILNLVIQEFEAEGFQVVGVQDVVGTDFTIPKGVLGRHAPSSEDWISIQRGIDVLKVLGTVDVGQSIVVQEGSVVGLEGLEGTDALMKRCVGLHPAGNGAILVKMCKPWQDRRVDLPVIGEKTLKTAIETGMKGIALQGEEVLILDQEKVVRMADQAGLFIIGF